METLEEWRARRNRALRELDIEWARSQTAEHCAATGRPMPTDRVLLVGLHKARYECTDIEDALRHDSRAWLERRGYGRSTGLPFSHDGTLPRGNDGSA